MPLKRLNPKDLVVDEALPWDLFDASGKLLLRQGQRIEQGPALARLLEQGLYRRDGATAEIASPPVSLSQMLLSPGDMLQLQLPGGSHGERYQVRMIGYHAPISLLVTAPKVNGRLVFVKEGQRFLVRGFVGKDAVGYSTRVLKSNLAPFAYLHLAWPEEVQTMRIRHSARVPVDLVCAVTYDNWQSAARIVDLSPGGARMVSVQPIAASGEQIRLAFRINPGGAEVYLNLTALVRTITEDGDQVTTGVEFVNLGEGDRLYLSNMVYQNLLKEKL